MKVYHIDRTNAGLLPNSRNNKSSSASMRKYQQLTLAIISIISLIAFLFYKHAYDRLHFTFEYLETFGTTADENEANFCGGRAYRKLYTTPAYWQKLTSDLSIYSTFWDTKSFTLSALVLYKGKHNVNVSITSEINVTAKPTECFIKAEESTKHRNIGLIICPNNLQIKKPFLAKFEASKDVAVQSTFVQISEKWKIAANSSCICIYSTSGFVTSQKLVEFLAYHNSIGIEKFVLYGRLLTPTVRKVLDMVEDEMGIFYEEKEFNSPVEFTLTATEYRKLVETDCALRHRNFYENVMALQPNEYIIIKGNPTLNGVISSLPLISKFNLVTQHVCYEMTDYNKPFVSMDLKTHPGSQDDTVAMIRPHLVFDSHFNQSLDNEQHIPMARIAMYNFVSCSSLKVESDSHLLMNNSYANYIEKSLLYKKWKIYDI